MHRKMVVAGQFYPADPDGIRGMFETYNRLLEEHLGDRTLLGHSARAVIVPHAGYVYSAFTANAAYRLLSNASLKTVVVIGPSHRVYLSGTSIGDFEDYETPFGALEIDRALVEKLRVRFDLVCLPQAHREHSTEVQMPFIAYYMPGVRVVELVYGEEQPAKLAQVIEEILKNPECGVVISTDLSHYYDQKMASRLDALCLQAVSDLDASKLHGGCEACGKIGVEAMLMAAKQQNWHAELLDYRTSADASGDESQVVGYMSAAFN